MTIGPREQGSAYAASQIHLWLSGDRPTLLADSPQFGPLWQWCLAHNITWGAALCASFDLGHRSSLDWIETATGWSPGCDKAAP